MLPPVISSGPETQMKVGSFHACVWCLTEQASLPPPCELQALPSHLGSSAEEKTDSICAVCMDFQKRIPKVDSFDSVRRKTPSNDNCH